ncbi:TPA: hypothetical protein DCZ36_00105, partial [Candidatus Gracilibacteria bacterium]|nr:hypothetical protein [Candidatus Gracilibacteria bacterium]
MPDISSLSKNKIVFFAVTGVVLLALIIGISMLGSSSSKKPQTKAPSELTVWVVGDESAGFSDIITGFKNRYPDYKNTDVKVTKFGNYVDYEKTLLTVLSDGNSPDIFVVNSSDGGLLESKILAIPSNIIHPDDFSKNFNKVFDDLVIENKEKDTSGADKTVSGIKGVPLGYQALGIFYNWKLVKTVPHLWSEIGGNSDSTTEDIGVQTIDDSRDYADMMLGLDGRYIPGASDILSLFLLQNDVPSYIKLADTNANNAIMRYFSFSGKTSVNTLAHIESTMRDLNLTTVDMFVRGKVAMIIGFPSLLREIEYAIKRAGSENVLSSVSLRTSEIPQISLDPKDAINLGEYNYFALSKTSLNPQAGYSFLAYLATGEAEEKYLQNFPMYLPAQRLREESKMSEAISKDYSRVKYRSFMNSETTLQTFDKGLKNEYDSYFTRVLGNIQKTPKDMLLEAIKYIDCNKKHL